MGQQANLTVYDGANTPVAHPFTATGTTPDRATWQELNSAIPSSAQARVKFTKSTTKGGQTVMAIRIEVPIQEVVTGANSEGYTAAPKVAFVETAEFRVFAHPRSTPTGRRNVRQLMINWLNQNTSSVAAAISGQGPDLIDWGVMPS